jgi:outer membrane lipoprotein SlyB
MFSKFATLVLICFAFTAHAQSWQGTSTGYGQFQQPQQVQKATVLSVRDVQLSSPAQGFGTASMLGTTIGGALGGMIGRQSNDFAVMAVTTTIGAALGNHVASGSAVREAQEIIYQVDGQSPQAVTQSIADGVRFAPGQRVILIGVGRIAPAAF